MFQRAANRDATPRGITFSRQGIYASVSSLTNHLQGLKTTPCTSEVIFQRRQNKRRQRQVHTRLLLYLLDDA
jgi:hypothetical protein